MIRDFICLCLSRFITSCQAHGRCSWLFGELTIFLGLNRNMKRSIYRMANSPKAHLLSLWPAPPESYGDPSPLGARVHRLLSCGPWLKLETRQVMPHTENWKQFLPSCSSTCEDLLFLIMSWKQGHLSPYIPQETTSFAIHTSRLWTGLCLSLHKTPSGLLW